LANNGVSVPLEMAREMAKHYRTLSEWMVQHAEALETGEASFHRGTEDASRELAEDLRHRANNIEALLMGFERIAARETAKSRPAPDASADAGAPG
jgi:hypothetical protein